jgi:choline dehydrogenase-like flavoprotein
LVPISRITPKFKSRITVSHYTLPFNQSVQAKLMFPVANLVTPNANSLSTNATYDAEQRALYDARRPSAYTIIRGLGSTFGALALNELQADASTIVPNPSSLPADTDAAVIAGYRAQQQVLQQQVRNSNMAVGLLAWNTYSSVTVSHIKPFSRGRITIKSTDPRAEPTIDYRTATDESDLRVLTGLLRKLRQVMSAPDMAVMGPTEAAPLGANVQSDEEIEAVLRANMGVSAAHQCCTSPMMPKNIGGVVDSKGKVYGTTNLRVVDVSTFPIAVSGGPAANVYAVAEKVSQLIDILWCMKQILTSPSLPI